MAPIGIAIVTYNRRDRLVALVEGVRQFTTSPYELVVAEDGGDDDTVAWCRANGVRVVTGPNRGVCWNKNRGLYALAALGCDPMLLLEDDSRPIEKGWEDHWRRASALWGHVSYAHPKIAKTHASGDGSAEAPFVSHKATAQCASISAEALGKLGFFDTRFQGYGVGHAEWTSRAKRLGYGSLPAPLPDGRMAGANLYITGGLVADDAPSFRDNEQVMQNRALLEIIRGEPSYRAPWATQEERAAFLAEIRTAGLPDTVPIHAPEPPKAKTDSAPAGKLDPQGISRAREELRRHLPDLTITTIVEVGAHLGDSVSAARRFYPDAQIHALEPTPATFAALSATFAGERRVTAHALALGATEGTAHILAKGTGPGAHRVPKPMPDRSVEVALTTGDRFMAAQALDRIGYLRIDTEGYELDILVGFQHALADATIDVIDVTAGLCADPKMLNTSFERLRGFLEPIGYRLFSIRNLVHDRAALLRRCSLVFVSSSVAASRMEAT